MEHGSRGGRRQRPPGAAGCYSGAVADQPINALVILGPTASGKTRLGVHLAAEHDGEVISADSRQVYRGLDIGAGKDLDEYVVAGQRVPHHLIDVVDLDVEFSVFDFQRRCYAAFEALAARGRLPVIVGGTGLYLEAALCGYRLVEVAEDARLRAALATLSEDELIARLRASTTPHNVTDTTDRERLVRAIEIAEGSRNAAAPPAPPLRPLVLGTRFDRETLKQRIRARLRERFDHGLVEEVQGLLDRGVSRERLHALGLEYRYVAQLLAGEIRNRNDLQQKLAAAIGAFAKRQVTWFRRMERRGVVIHWLDGADLAAARRVVRAALGRGAQEGAR